MRGSLLPPAGKPAAAGPGRTPLATSQSAAAFFQGTPMQPHLIDRLGRPVAPTSMVFPLPFFLPPLSGQEAMHASVPLARTRRQPLAGGKRSPPKRVGGHRSSPVRSGVSPTPMPYVSQGRANRVRTEPPAVGRRTPAIPNDEPACLLDMLEDPSFEEHLLASVFGEEEVSEDELSNEDPEQPPAATPLPNEPAAGEQSLVADHHDEESSTPLPAPPSRSPPTRTMADTGMIRRLGTTGARVNRLQTSQSEGALVPSRSRGLRLHSKEDEADIGETEREEPSSPGPQLGPSGNGGANLPGGGAAADPYLASAGMVGLGGAPSPDIRRQKRKGTRATANALARMLDDSLTPTEYESSISKYHGRGSTGEATISQVQSLRDALRRTDVMDRVIDLFHKCDVDRNGEVSMPEFTTCIKTLLPETPMADIQAIYKEFDESGDGSISYEEMFQTLKRASVKQTAFTVPPLPKDLALRRRDVLNLYKEIEQKKADTSHVAPGVTLPTFEEALRLYYPKDSKEKTNMLIKWVNDLLAAKDATQEARTREADAALIQQLDADGSNSISITEFCELSKRTGLSKAQMRARFRDKDFGNAGVLSVEQMREVLQEMRAEQRLRSNKNDNLDLEVFAGLRAFGDAGGGGRDRSPGARRKVQL